jgi:hypothetical protein
MARGKGLKGGRLRKGRLRGAAGSERAKTRLGYSPNLGKEVGE